MKLNEVVSGRWHAHPTNKGVKVRVITKASRDAADQKAVEAAARKAGATKEAKLEALRTKPIPDFDVEDIRKLMKKEKFNFPEIDHMVSKKDGTISASTSYSGSEKVTVASRLYRFYVNIDLKKDMGFDDGTIKDMYDGNPTTEEIMAVRIFRDPNNPSKFLLNPAA